MNNLFQTDESGESKLYDIHLDQLADKDYENFIKRIDYIDEGPVLITHTFNKEGYYQYPI